MEETQKVSAPEAQEKPIAVEQQAAEKPKAADDGEKKIMQSVSFKEETTVVDELPELQQKALDELKQLVQDALNKHEFTAPSKDAQKTEEKASSTEEAAGAEKKLPEEPPKTEAGSSSQPAETKEEEAPPPQDAVEVNEDGTETVKAIEETVLAVSPPAADDSPAKDPVPPEKVSIWGIPLLQDERSDVVLLKFLRARDFKAKEAFSMIRSTVRWREEFRIEALLEENLGGNDFNKAVFMSGVDKEGHPVCYNVFGEFQNKELYQAAFSDGERREKFLRWRIQFLEKSIRTLDFSPGGISTIVQVNDLRNSPGPGKKELRQTTNQALSILQDNYPEFVARQVFINVPWWYLAFNKVMGPFLTQRTKSKFVFAGPSKTADTLFRYMAPERVPVQYGGLKRDEEQEFTAAEAVTEFIVKPATKHAVELPVCEGDVVVWEVRVLGWEVSYGCEFVPSAADGYTVIVQKARKVAAADETVIAANFKAGEQGKVVFTVDNAGSRKKKMMYRSKTKPGSDSKI